MPSADASRSHLARVDVSFALTLARQGCVDFIVGEVHLHGVDIFYLAKIHCQPLARLISRGTPPGLDIFICCKDGSLPSSQEEAVIAF